MQRTRALIACGLIMYLTGCGGSNSVNTTPIPTAPTIPTQAAFSATTVTSLATTTQTGGNIPVTLPASNGFAGSVSLPAPAGTIPAGASLAESIGNTSATLPAGIPPLFDGRRGAQAVRHAQDATSTPILFVELTSSFTLVLPNAPSFVFSIPADEIVPNVNYYLALYDPLRPSLGWQDGFEGPAVISGTTLTFTAPTPASPFTLTASVPEYFAVYGVLTSIAAPTPAPSISPAPAPTAPPNFTLSSSSISLLAPGATATATISDPTAYTGSYAAVTSSTSVATVAVSGTTVTVTAAGPGTATITVADAQARTATISVQVTTTNLPVQ